MSKSSFRRLWDTVKPPPAVPRRAGRVPATEISWFQRTIAAIKPPPAVKAEDSKISAEDKRNRRRILVIATSVVAVGGTAWGAYLYVSSAPTRAERVFQDGVLLMGKGDFKGAEARFTRAVDIWPQLASGYFQRGLARREQQRTDAAIEDF